MISEGKRARLRKGCKKDATHISPSVRATFTGFVVSFLQCDVFDGTTFTADRYALCDYCARELRLVW